jgi:hypothetical protein
MLALDSDLLAILHIWTLETNQEVDTLVTWNTKHFKGKTPLKVLTPSELL